MDFVLSIDCIEAGCRWCWHVPDYSTTNAAALLPQLAGQDGEASIFNHDTIDIDYWLVAQQ